MKTIASIFGWLACVFMFATVVLKLRAYGQELWPYTLLIAAFNLGIWKALVWNSK